MKADTTRASRLKTLLIAGASALAVAGCATTGSDQAVVQTLVGDRVAHEISLPTTGTSTALSPTALDERLTQPLSAAAAVQLAILNNRGLRASLAGLGVVEADLVQAGRLVNPVFSFSNIRNSDAQSIERVLIVNLLAIATMPLRQTVAGRQLDAARLETASDVVRLAADTRKAWVAAVAAQESVKYFEQVRTAAEASAELASRMARVGNFTKLAYMREQAFYAEATAQLARARLAAATERERLTRLLGLSSPNLGYTLPDRLPDLPATPIEPANAEQMALDRRLDVQLARRSTEALASDLGLSRATRFINVLEAGYANESETGERRKNGYEIEISIPIFDWGDAKLARAEAVYMQSVHRTAEVALAAQSEVRASYQAYRTAYDLARHYRDEIVPLRKRIADENMLRYNGMLIGVFELLADSREQVASVNGYLESLRDFWLAQADFDLAQSGAAQNGATRTRGAAMQSGSARAGH
ncbi:MAG TPA: TolC family protein [Casimicrobiaceae bacterium]|nr:TolC family protein [Casimicrobiaceae bacterium]